MTSLSAKVSRLVISALALAYSCGGGIADTRAPADGTVDALDATVAIVNAEGYSFCAGVFVGHYVVTAQHCVGNNATVQVGLYRDWNHKNWTRSVKFSVAHVDDVQDLAILSPAEVLSDDSHSSVHLAEAPPFYGQQVVVIGHPLGLVYSIVDGVVSSPERDMGPFDEMVWFQISAPVSPGNSGGPVLNRWGELLGVVSFRLISRQGSEAHLGGAVHWLTIRSALGSVVE